MVGQERDGTGTTINMFLFTEIMRFVLPFFHVLSMSLAQRLNELAVANSQGLLK
ncbi:hypothetical protein CPB84DRAFT_1779622 [Gymnopilus junonius]|uniref:Uncharacterized protein n=1 Tax=Gymnopilus junonius TaxID=109634 RepID=A0A9P5NP24_GYMJU|nr:hypothetical protein CPB84DRAFT_1779622 [Gymnopilus junonius]